MSAGERANLHAVCARHCATGGDRQAGLRHVALADEVLTRPGTGDVPEWARRVTASAGHHDSAIGLALYELGDDARAAKRLSAALKALGPGRVRTTLRCRTRLAVLHLRQGDRAAGQREVHTALSDAAHVRSQRITTDLRMVAREAARVGCDALAAAVRSHLGPSTAQPG